MACLVPALVAGTTPAVLLHGEGVNDGTVFTDTSGKVWTPNNEIVTTTDESKFGTSSIYFIPFTSGLTYLNTPQHADFAFGTGDFTIEMWVKFIEGGSNDAVTLANCYDGTTAGGWTFFYHYGNKELAWRSFNSTNEWIGGIEVSTPTSPLGDGLWHYCKAHRAAGVLKVQFDSLVSNAEPDPTNYAQQGGVFAIGGNVFSNDSEFAGYIDEYRVQKGVGVTSTTIPTAAFT